MSYLIKVWIFTIIVSPLLIALILGVIISNSRFDSIFSSYEMISLMIIIGFVFSSPAMVIFGFIKRSLKNKYTELRQKIILSIYAFLSVWITFFVVDNGFITRCSEQTIWVLIYSLTIVLGIWLFKIKEKEII